MSTKYPGEKLLHPSSYGSEEYLVIGLSIFVVFVVVKHLIFHTFYFWWYREGQFYIPNKFWTFLSGKSLTKRLLAYVLKCTNKDNVSIDKLMRILDAYFKHKEFAPSLSIEKGEIVDHIVTEHCPKEILVVGCHVGYVLLQILKSSPDNVRIFVVESKVEFVEFAEFLLKTIGQLNNKQVFFVASNLNKKVLANMKTDYGVTQFDFVFLNRSEYGLPSHVPLLKLLEGEEGESYLHSCSNEGQKSVILADKVVLLGDNEYLKYVRCSEKFETKYYQMALEHSSEEIVDGMEKAIYVGK